MCGGYRQQTSVTNAFAASRQPCDDDLPVNFGEAKYLQVIAASARANNYFEDETILESDTIIGVPFEPCALRSMLQNQPGTDGDVGAEHEQLHQRLFKIRSASSCGQRRSASILIDRMYRGRGYLSTPLTDQQMPTRMTLVANDHDTTIGTITIGFDSAAGLHADEPFGPETHALREAGHTVCEFTKLAMDSVVRSKRVLASLFHVAYIYAYRTMGFDTLLIEVNPRHVRYYKEMLGFEQLGPKRFNSRVNAPSVLLSLDFAHAHDQIKRFGGRSEYSLVERSLYPYFFSISEEAAIVGRLAQGQAQPFHFMRRSPHFRSAGAPVQA